MTSTKKPRKIMWIIIILSLGVITFLATQLSVGKGSVKNERAMVELREYVKGPVVLRGGQSITSCIDQRITSQTPGYIDFTNLSGVMLPNFKTYSDAHGLAKRHSDGRIPGWWGMPPHSKICKIRPPRNSTAYIFENLKTLREGHEVFKYDREAYGYADYRVFFKNGKAILIVGRFH